MIRLLRHDDSVNREDDGAVKFEDLASIFRSRIMSFSHWSIRTCLSFLQRGGGIKKRFRCCVDPSSPETFQNLRAIQGHSGGKHIDPTLQDNVLLPNDFAEHIFHVGSSHDLHSVVQSGLIPGGKDAKKGRHAVFFTAVNPMFVDQHKEFRVRPDEFQNCSVQNHWRVHQSTVFCCNLRVAQNKGLQFYQTRSSATVIYDALSAMRTERVVYMKSGEELNNKVYQSPRVPRKAVLMPILHHGRQDLPNLDARTSVVHQSQESEEYGETVAIAAAAEEPKSSGKPAAVTLTSAYKVYHT